VEKPPVLEKKITSSLIFVPTRQAAIEGIPNSKRYHNCSRTSSNQLRWAIQSRSCGKIL